MSLSAREEQILGSIEDGLAGSDPKLAWMLATFTRLASGEEMPARDKVRAVRLAADLRGRRQPRRDGARRRARRLGQRLDLAQYRGLWLAAAVALVTVALVTVALAVSHGGSGSGPGSCTASWPAVCTGQVPAHPPGAGARQAASGQSPRAGWVPAPRQQRPTRTALASCRSDDQGQQGEREHRVQDAGEHQARQPESGAEVGRDRSVAASLPQEQYPSISLHLYRGAIY